MFCVIASCSCKFLLVRFQQNLIARTSAATAAVFARQMSRLQAVGLKALERGRTMPKSGMFLCSLQCKAFYGSQNVTFRCLCIEFGQWIACWKDACTKHEWVGTLIRSWLMPKGVSLKVEPDVPFFCATAAMRDGSAFWCMFGVSIPMQGSLADLEICKTCDK
jgi:hypothetical protein